MTDKVIGLVGVGLMGLGIATNIVGKGWSLGFVDHPGNQPTDDLIAAGAKPYGTAEELTAASDIVILCVTGSPQVEDVLTRSDGVLAGMRAGTIIIDCSTAIPTSTMVLADKVIDAGGLFLDAPMTRTPKEAMEGRLNLIVGGDKILFDQILPLLESFAENIAYAGKIGDGHTLKLLHNFVSLGFATVLAEAASVSARAGIAPETLLDILANGGGGGVVLERLRPFIESEDTSGFRFSLSNAHKDIGYYRQMASDLDGAHASADGIFKCLDDQIEAGRGHAILPELVRFLQEDDA